MDSIPWYHSRVIVGILTIVVTQVLAKVHRKYQLNLEVYGITVDSVVQTVLDGISALAAYIALNARVTKPMPPVKLPFTKGAA